MADSQHSSPTSPETLLDQGRCPYCGWLTVVAGRGQVCGSCVREKVAERIANLEEQLDSEQRLREAAEQQYAAAEVQYGTLKEQYEDLLRQRIELQNSIGGYIVQTDELCRQRGDAWNENARLKEQLEDVQRERDAARRVNETLTLEFNSEIKALANFNEATRAAYATLTSSGVGVGAVSPSGSPAPDPATKPAGVPPGDRSPIGREALGDDAGEPQASSPASRSEDG